MVKRKIIKIDLEKCSGCGVCIPDCPEGALQIIDGKARLISDLFCDGLGACIKSCPVDAIAIEERDAENYSEKKVMGNIVKQGENVVTAHLRHLRDHNEQGYLKEAIEFLKEKGEVPKEFSSELTKDTGVKPTEDIGTEKKSLLKQWPIQLHLISPQAPYFQKQDVLLCSDCVAYAYSDFHSRYLKGKSLAIACPKLDGNQDVYKEKIKLLIDEAKINTITILIMDVPCCRGLLGIAQPAVGEAKRKIPLKLVVVGIKGEILQEDWI